MTRHRRAAGCAPTCEEDRAPIAGLLRRTGLFGENEVAVALEVLDVYLFQEGQEDYRFFSAFSGGEVAGYVCFGLNSMTQGTFELYWIAVDPSSLRRGLGSDLLERAERESLLQGCRKMAVETSSRRDYAPALSFYRRHGYRVEARVPDFYAPGDDKLILVKDFPPCS
jgi:ribosomal protein S18 acetylase RimI-like enzyme